MVAVLPGVPETIAREPDEPPPPPPFARPARQLTREDLPTLERPRSANSGRKGPDGGIAGQPAGVTEEPTYSAVLTRISRGVGSSSEFGEEEEGDEEDDGEAEAMTTVESIRSFLRLPPPTRLDPVTGAAARARQRASVRVATRSMRALLRAGEEEASKGKRVLLPKALPTDG